MYLLCISVFLTTICYALLVAGEEVLRGIAGANRTAWSVWTFGLLLPPSFGLVISLHLCSKARVNLDEKEYWARLAVAMTVALLGGLVSLGVVAVMNNFL